MSTGWSYRFKFSQEDCSSVTIAGEFNDWDMKGLAMTRVDGSTKEWEAYQKFDDHLAGTKIQFKFVVDGHRWQATPDIPLEEDGNGNINNVITVGIDLKLEEKEDDVKELTNLEVPRMLLNRAHKVCTQENAEIFMHSQTDDTIVVVRQLPFDMLEDFDAFVTISRFSFGHQS